MCDWNTNLKYDNGGEKMGYKQGFKKGKKFSNWYGTTSSDNAWMTGVENKENKIEHENQDETEKNQSKWRKWKWKWKLTRDGWLIWSRTTRNSRDTTWTKRNQYNHSRYKKWRRRKWWCQNWRRGREWWQQI